MKLYLRNIKKGFGTNSSSYHSTIVLTLKEFEKWKSGKIKIDKWGDGYEEDMITYDEWGNYYETDITYYTSPSGDELVILCEHGFDG